MGFATLGLSPALVRAAREHGLHVPTPIQAAAVPAVLRGADVRGRAQTGSGKTAAFVLPLLQQIERTAQALGHRAAGRRQRLPHALILVPTRELAQQVGQAVQGLARHLAAPVKVATLFGGVSINPQMMGLRGGADVVVATPGRLLDLLDHRALSLAAVGVLVLDEADRLLDDGFADELSRLLALLPLRRQNLLFSATFPVAVQSLAEALLREPVHIDLPSEPATAPDIQQRAIEVDTPRRTQLLRHLIAQGAWRRTLVFVATRYASEHVAGKLVGAGISAAAFHGELSQGRRTQVLDDFKAGRLQVLLATDMAARGLDIVDLPVVVNFDLPRAASDHVHRIGRVGRAGASGLAVSFISADTEAHFRLIEKRLGQRVPREQITGFEPVEAASAVPPDATGGIKGRRKSKKDKLREAAARGEG